MDQSLQDKIKKALGVLTLFLVLLCIHSVINILRGDNSAGRNYDTITVDAQAEVFATPDIAEISFSIRKEDKELVKAQEDIEIRVKASIESLKQLGVEEKDIKTTYYSANPRYEYGKAICLQYRCDDGERALVGYEANQSISVTVRNLDNVGRVIASLGSAKVSDIYGPNFRVENEDDLKAKAREEAITKAKAKAKVLAKNLNVRIIGIENFSEGYGGGIFYTKAEMGGMTTDSSMPAPSNFTIPQGENKIQTSVTITYRVR